MRLKTIEELFKLPLPIILILIGLAMLDGKLKLIVEDELNNELGSKEFDA
ncbi:hypothetical protein JGI1_02284 [Candidatus Thermokryptus mobilis]|uniref:Uncharacterized protein n=1 Tax=Candidatus Thermokryptus mobilis TaxID=1643428 RepID=A0A0S4NGI8_9BACT|nr:hypothetical protein [Candidatus Thermokryptus mobilis]CUU09181.1 hypothetical protein JGI1_02284 [Candidatus Thermokryptus mobilis]